MISLPPDTGELDDFLARRRASFLNELDRSRRTVYHCLRRASSTSDIVIAQMATEQLLGLALLLRFVRQSRVDAVPSIEHLFDTNHDRTIRQMIRDIQRQIISPVLRAVFDPDDWDDAMPLPDGLHRYRYHAMTLSGSSARVMVRDYVTGHFGELCSAIEAWFADLEIAARDGMGLAPSPKFGAVLAGMVRELKDIAPQTAAKLWRCAVLDEPIPDPFAAQALSRIRIDFIKGESPNHARMGLLRAHLYRKGDHDVKPYLNEEHPDPAYHCGRLLAVLDDIQRAALGDVGAGVVQRFYAAATTTPALVLGRLHSLATVAHLPKIDGGLQRWHRDRLARVWGQLKQDPPTILSLHQQTLFAMGYYQQKAQPKSTTSEKE